MLVVVGGNASFAQSPQSAVGDPATAPWPRSPYPAYGAGNGGNVPAPALQPAPKRPAPRPAPVVSTPRMMETIVPVSAAVASSEPRMVDSALLQVQAKPLETIAAAPSDCFSCNDSCCDDCCPPCGPPGRCWVRAEALLWWSRGSNTPPLVTQGTNPANGGILGAPDTTVLFGGESLNEDLRLGGRITVGTWLNCRHTCGVETYFFGTMGDQDGINAGGAGDPIVSRPFTDATDGVQDVELVSFPGVLAGRVDVDASSSGLLGAGALLRCNLCCGCDYRVDVIGGYRWLRFNDRVAITEDLLVLDAVFGVEPGTNIRVYDSFKAFNDFHGLELGLDGELRSGDFFFGWLAKLAVGKNFRQVQIEGQTVVTSPAGAVAVNRGGLLTQLSNIGTYNFDEYTVIPELGVRVGYQLGDLCRLSVGYTFIYWPGVVRAGEQIDLVVNPRLIPPVIIPPAFVGPLRPAALLADSDMWIQGLNLGVEFRF